MKYWRGYLTAGVMAFFTWALMQFAKTHQTLVDMVYPYVSRMVQTFLADWSSSVDFCLWQLILVVLAVILLATIVLMIILKWNPIQWLGWVLAAGCFLYMLHTCAYGLNYYSGPLAEDIKIEVIECTVSDIEEAGIYYRDIANQLAGQMNRDAQGNLVFSDFDTLAQQAGDGFQTMTYEEYQPVFAGSTVPVKKLGWSETFSSMGITGIHSALTGEAAVNPDIPAVSLPFVICREMAHRMCIAQDQDACFAAFLACRANESLEFQYSAYFMAYKSCYDGLIAMGTGIAKEAAQRLSSGVSDLLYQDLVSYRSYFSSHEDEKAVQLASSANDLYLKTSGDASGIGAYDELCQLLVSWHYDTIILPQHIVEEDPFDPFDETQVDLSGITNAKESYDHNEGSGE